ncbi:hypothetical protein BDV97DRAFT_346242 [Delphinella strobiligena]|nr:hypothetical protein BDV97DRAFT_346242 [Delphinella strobiligena]
MTSTPTSSDTVTIATHIELIRCQPTNSSDPESPLVTPIEARTEVVVITDCSEYNHLLDIIWKNVVQQWSRSGFLNLPSTDSDAYGHILRLWYVLQGGSRERCHDLLDCNWNRTLQFLKSGTTSNIYLQFFFWPRGDEKSETVSPPPYQLEDRDRNDGQIEMSHTSERQNETTLENQDVEEDEVESHIPDQEAHCPDGPDGPEEPRIDSAASSPVCGDWVRKNSTSKVLLRTGGCTEPNPCPGSWVVSFVR